MDISALDKALSTLESQISGVEQYVDGLEKWLWISSVAVIVGVAFEVYFVIHQYGDDRDEWLRGIVMPPARPSRRILAGEIASIICVVLGIAGELGIGILSSNANAKLRTLNNSRLGLVRQKANDANNRATNASNEATKAAEHEENLETRTEREMNSRLELERRFIWQGPRDIPINAAREMLIVRLQKFSGQKFRDSVCTSDMSQTSMFPDDSEVLRTEFALRAILKESGWIAVPSPPDPFVGLPTDVPPALILGCSSHEIVTTTQSDAPSITKSAADLLALVLSDALSDRQVAVSRDARMAYIPRLDPPNKLPPDVIEIHVGAHPTHPAPFENKSTTAKATGRKP